ncbi:hypothetical protein [Phytohabitans aurantiacus]|jgi:hypothetical protein|uniref:Uncharacterized protein n=1 Tax=Phytohabitans aurantiacus TaxID=3016789 RepID=A0ABQ5R3J2_9ACTN|nr:hypothetical protein [Phytohabitans aurantiacus]GLI00447.1 hypothetical protein Pa4123_57230 [Phytohabitans aurantiacus]
MSEAVLSKRTLRDVFKHFPAETERALRFLVDDYELNGPEYTDIVLPAIAFMGSGVRYRVMLDLSDQVVLVHVEIDAGSGTLVAHLEDVVVKAGLAKPGIMSDRVHNLSTLHRALDSRAAYIRSLHPLLVGGAAIELMRKAGARERRG